MNKDNDWIDFLRKEEESFLPEPPEDLWSDISSHLLVSPKPKHKVVPLWVRYSAVAACIALLFCLGWYLRMYQDVSSPSSSAGNVTSNTISQPIIDKASTNSRKGSHEYSLPKNAMNRDADQSTSSTNVNILAQTISSSVNSEDTVIVTKSDNSNESNKTSHQSHDKDKRTLTRGNSLIAYEPNNTSKQRGISLSLLAGNLATNSSSSQHGYNVLTSAPSDGISDETYEDIEILTQGSEVNTKKRYRIPLRTGIRISLPLSSRLSFESGLSYTRLSSSVESGSSEDYYSTEQTLHYVGIPLKLRYQIWENKHIGVYVSGGGMVEKCVHGNSQTDFIIAGVKYSETEQDISEKPLQLSAALSAGIEAQLSSNVKLFVEPGLNYYIDNHSNVDNSYKDKPLNLDLSIGVRLNINK